MKKTPGNNDLETLTGPRRRIRIAYALNNEQPVKCSIISDQPLFYMDFEGDIEDESDFDGLFGLESTSIETDVEDLKERIAALGCGIDEDAMQAAKAAVEFFSDSASMTMPATVNTPEDYTFEQATLVKIIKQSRLAASYLECGAKYGSTIRMSDQVESALYDRKDGHIYINPNLPRAEQVLLAARELRRLWQHRSGSLLNPLTFHPDQAIMVNRAQIADLMANMVRIAWELQLSGEKEPWIRLEQSPMADLTRAFAREAYLDFRTLNNGVAASSVFEAWFISDRCKHEDRKLIQLMLADYKGYVFEGAQSSKAVSADLMMALGSMPFGKNYLAPYINTLLSDALFTEVRDRSNANFLWFIKFERSFRETEQELQTVEGINSHASESGNTHNNKRFGDHEKTADVISLPFGEGNPARAGSGMDKGALSGTGGARIIPFHGQSGQS